MARVRYVLTMFGIAGLLASLFACGGSKAVPPPTWVSPSASRAVTTAVATVQTAGSGCDDTAKKGDCWLPLYPTRQLAGTPLNMSGAANSSCTKQKEDRCWPQPNTEVSVVCQANGPDGAVWFGVSVPADKILTLNDAAKPDGNGGFIGYNRSQWLVLRPNQPRLPACP